MRWGIAFLAWVLVAIYLVSGCVDYVRVWTNQPRYRETVRPLMTACAERNALRLGVATGVLVALYLGSGWAIARVRADERKNRQRAESSSDVGK
jgi:hypothetical protein